MTKIVRIVTVALWSLVVGGVLVGCQEDEEPIVPPTPVEIPAPYGHFYFGEERTPVVSYSVASEGLFVLKLSPLEDILSATTYAIVGVHEAFLGERIDVTTKYHNEDYVFVYEDPGYYFAPWRALRSGTILLDRNSAGVVRADVDVVLYDGTTFRYQNMSLQPVD